MQRRRGGVRSVELLTFPETTPVTCPGAATSSTGAAMRGTGLGQVIDRLFELPARAS
ncbi:MAG: hypothetical protein M3P85_09970 [Actinomycetota bacterium]|nr:hypothetical protein [Actinomycetota bacterium]